MPDSKHRNEENSRRESRVFPAALYAELPDLIRSACWQFHYFPTPEEIEDRRAEIIVRFLEHDGYLLQTFDAERGTLKTWLHTVVRNYVGKHLKRRQKWDSLEDVLPEILLEQPRQELNVKAQEQFIAVARVVPQLSARQQELFRLVCEECSTIEIAQRLKLKPESVRRMKYELRQKIKAGLGKNGGANRVPNRVGRKMKINEKSESTFLFVKTIWIVKGHKRIKKEYLFIRKAGKLCSFVVL